VAYGKQIYQLCDIDPKRAASAIRDFSEYLRANFDSLKRKDVVPFEAEFKHVKTYLHIEQMLYEDGLNVFYDIKEKNFRLPALTIQPVVEHAIEHSVAVTMERLAGKGTVVTIFIPCDEPDFYN